MVSPLLLRLTQRAGMLHLAPRGPYGSSDLSSGFVILEAESMDEAVRIASEWPSLSTQPNATVQLQPVFTRD
jgi:hypothetical protein